MRTTSRCVRLVAPGLCALYLGIATLEGQNDPGPRSGAANAGGPTANLGADFTNLFYAARTLFQEIDSVSGGIAGEAGVGLGPAFNGNSCAACHAQPDVGGTSPHPTLGQVNEPNPEVAYATLDRLPGKNQIVPSFITVAGPVREARFIATLNGDKLTPDGTIHDLYTIAGRIDGGPCSLAQQDFAAAIARNNVVFRIPTPVFGLGLVENTPDAALRDNLAATQAIPAAKGIHGVLNTDREGTVTRFGWKAQSKSLLAFAAEHYNIEQGVSNEGSPNKRLAIPGCVFNPTAEDISHIRNPAASSLTGTLSEMSSNTVNFGFFMRLSAPPAQTTASQSELNGAALFTSIGCAFCHSSTLQTASSPYPGQSGVTYHPYSDFALHHMGSNLADGIVQGAAGPDMFRTAPLWGLGQRIFFLHDGRMMNLLDAIQAHFSRGHLCSGSEIFEENDGGGPIALNQDCASEANTVIQSFNQLTPSQRQDILNFLRSL